VIHQSYYYFSQLDKKCYNSSKVMFERTNTCTNVNVYDIRLKPYDFGGASTSMDINLNRIFSFGEHVSVRNHFIFQLYSSENLNFIHRSSVVVHCGSLGCSNSWISRHRQALDQSERKKASVGRETALLSVSREDFSNLYHYCIAYLSIAVSVS
jgi:hypothetical protein